MTISMKSTALGVGLAVATLTGTAGIASAASGPNTPTTKALTTKPATVKPAGFQNAACYREPVYRNRWTPYGWREVFVGYRTRCYDRGPGLRFYFGF